MPGRALATADLPSAWLVASVQSQSIMSGHMSTYPSCGMPTYPSYHMPTYPSYDRVCKHASTHGWQGIPLTGRQESFGLWTPIQQGILGGGGTDRQTGGANSRRRADQHQDGGRGRATVWRRPGTVRCRKVEEAGDRSMCSQSNPTTTSSSRSLPQRCANPTHPILPLPPPNKPH